MERAEPGSPALARAADGLTFARAVLGLAIGILAAEGWLAGAAVTLSLAWATDWFDGRLARASRAATRLGDWDMAVDVLVGAALLTGLGLSRTVSPWLAAGVVVGLGVGYVVLREAAIGMVLQAVAYGAFLWNLWREGGTIRWVPIAVALAIGVVEARRLVRVVIPEFLRGIGRAVRMRRGASFGLPHDE